MKISLNHMVAPRLDHAAFFDLTRRLGLLDVEIRNDLKGVAVADGTPASDVGAAAKERDLTILSNDRRFIRLRFEWNSLSTRSNAHCKVVAATRYAPASFRGVSALTRATGFGRVANYGQRAHEEICLLVQVETQEALDHLEEVAGVEGIDGVFIGPRGSRG